MSRAKAVPQPSFTGEDKERPLTMSIPPILFGGARLFTSGLLPSGEDGVTGAAPLIGVERPTLVGGVGETPPQNDIVLP